MHTMEIPLLKTQLLDELARAAHWREYFPTFAH